MKRKGQGDLNAARKTPPHPSTKPSKTTKTRNSKLPPPMQLAQQPLELYSHLISPRNETLSYNHLLTKQWEARELQFGCL